MAHEAEDPVMDRRPQWLTTSDGWRLDLVRFVDPGRHDPARRPLLLVPGYCMNSFILSFHPRGISLVEYLTRAGYEVWTSDLRGQGDAQPPSGGAAEVGFRAIAQIDLPAVLDRVQADTASRADGVDAIGCSLGGTYLFAYLAHHPHSHPIRALVGMGAPLEWRKAHPLLTVAFASPRLAGRLRVSGTRRMARVALPVAKRVPRLLDLYMNTAHIDLSQADVLTQTVDDPHPRLNRQIARWVKQRSLRVAGLDVAAALGATALPYLGIYANADGIVPPETARSAIDVFGARATGLEVGDDDVWFAHADMFINDQAEQRVFGPLVDWLDRAQGA